MCKSQSVTECEDHTAWRILAEVLAIRIEYSPEFGLICLLYMWLNISCLLMLVMGSYYPIGLKHFQFNVVQVDS